MSTREYGKIAKVFEGIEPGHQVPILTIWFDFDGSSQAFQACLKSPEVVAAMAKSIRDFFEVKTNEQLVGRSCYVLRSFPDWGEPIEGFEERLAGSGGRRRWTLTRYMREYVDPNYEDRLTTQTKRIRSELAHLQRRMSELVEGAFSIAGKYVDWSAP